MKTQRIYILAFLFFLLSEISLYCFYANLPPKTNEENPLVNFIPERFRSFIAALLWERADELMHRGPVISKQNFFAGSFAGNTDIIPYMKMVIELCPKEVSPYRILASNYAYHLGMKNEALNLINKAIKKCTSTVYVHELYASVAFVCLFGSDAQNQIQKKKDLEMAEEYISKAIDAYIKPKELSNHALNLENYYTVQARILWELEKYDKALESWIKSGHELEKSDDRLAASLLKYKQTGIAEKIITPIVNKKPHLNNYEHEHEHNHVHHNHHH